MISFTTRPTVLQCQALLSDYVRLLHVVIVAAHLVDFFGCMGRGDYSEMFLLEVLFSFMVKSPGLVVGCGP